MYQITRIEAKNRDRPIVVPEILVRKGYRSVGEHVADLKGNRRIPDGKTVYDVLKGVLVGVKRTYGKKRNGISCIVLLKVRKRLG